MAKKTVTRRELLDRWRGIEEDENENGDNDDPSLSNRLNQLKEQWFADAFNFLILLPKETHIWCGSWDLMGPLMETFYNYFKDEREDSPLRLLWKRISKEMRECIPCISKHHQAQEMYSMEYELSTVGPLLDVLRSLDEDRLTQHLKEINAKVAREDYVAQCDNSGIVCVMYEVMMFPFLLDDESLFTEFEVFIEAIDNAHEVALAGQQQFPGVYALFFFKRRVRSIGHRLAGSMGKLRRVTDLEPLQPLLKKFIGLLEMEALPSNFEHSTPKAQLERMSIWLGIKSLIGFLEPQVFEDGILERYPIFFDIVLNHISGDSHEFSHAVSCLGLLFEMLGCKLWLRSTLSPSVMCNTLLGQCFHTRSEKIHKDIFDLFQPFLQSLEALQDGEHEKQRRHFIYFLLHQVPISSNFSILIRKKACQIALLIVHRGYKMNPPCPPFECSHMWGPPLLSSLKDSSLHISLRQPAFDLIETIIVSDSSALTTSLLEHCTSLFGERSMLIGLNDNEVECGLSSAPDFEEKDDSSWIKFGAQSKITSGEYKGWMCIPMLWIDVLVELSPTVLPVSFSKAVFWSRSRFPLIEPETSAEMELPIKAWFSSFAVEISTSVGWRIPTGSDDGGAEESKNSIKVSTKYLSLIRTFNRLTAHFVVQLHKGELWKQWTWEPRMGESLILLLLDPNDSVRQISKCVLEQVSSTRGLASGLKFLCTCKSSLFAILSGLGHALTLVQLDFVLSKFETLQHLLFILSKLLQEGFFPTIDFREGSCDNSSVTKFSSQGGFLRHPVVDSFPKNANEHSANVDLKLWEKFCFLLSEIAWPTILKCLVEGKLFVDYSLCQITCVRILEIFPIIFEKLWLHGKYETASAHIFDFKWLLDLMEWGKTSLQVVNVYWKRAVTALLNVLKKSHPDTYVSQIIAIENLISSDVASMGELMEKVSHMSISLSNEASSNTGKKKLRSKPSYSERLDFERKYPAANVQGMNLGMLSKESNKNNVIILSDNETEEKISPKMVIPSDIIHPALDAKKVDSYTGKSDGHISVNESKRDAVEIFSEKSRGKLDGHISVNESKKDAVEIFSEKSRGKLARASLLNIPAKKNVFSSENSIGSLEGYDQRDATMGLHLASEKQESDEFRGKSAPASLFMSKCADSKTKHINANSMNEAQNMELKELVQDKEGDLLESALKSTKHQQLHMAKLGTSVTKRHIIQLEMPTENRSGHLRRLEPGVKRFKPPRLEDWYRLILEIDYFATVGLTSAVDENQGIKKLKEVPVCFQSPEQYVKIFRPLVLEEFKAQLHSSFMEMSSLDDIYFGSIAVLSIERVDDFHLIRFSHDDNDSSSSKSFSENDLVLLTKEPPHNSSHDVHVVGKLEKRERDNKRRISILLIRFYFLNGSLRLNQARRHLLERSKWHASRILSITPQLREFQALSSIKSIPAHPVILEPANASLINNEYRELDLGKLPPLFQQIKSTFNESQLKAISVASGSSTRKKDFNLSLIQGPPGTGKTRTIVAIVSCLLATPMQRMNVARNTWNQSLKQDNTSSTNLRQQISQSAAIARAWQDAALAKQLNEDVERISKPSGNSSRGRVLICAQSNAAVDELVSRISTEGLWGNDGKIYKPYLVRVGNAKTVHPNSLAFFIDTLVDHRLAEERSRMADAKNKMSVDSSVALRSKLEKLADCIRFHEAKRANLRDENLNTKDTLEDEIYKEDNGKQISDADIEVKLKKLYEQKRQIYKDLSTAQAQERKTNIETKELRHKLRKSILKEAEIVVTTLSGSGGDLYGVCSESMSSNKFGSPSEHTLFDAVVIDEAAQALEPATLIPLQLLKSNGTKCVMVGDPKQLPATVLSNVACKYLYQCSMFERLQRAGHPVIMLTEQYRMHPEICRFPALHFYERKLLNGKHMSSKSAPFHETEGLGPYVFYDIIDGQEVRNNNSGAMSLANEHEADAAVEVLSFFKKRYPCEFLGGRIGIITPYKHQLSLLRSRFSSTFGSSVTADMEFNTVDGFQGREVDILILSTVRAVEPRFATPNSNSSSIGFVADVRRMNVALTRAKLSLWILGNSRTLQTNQNWAALVKDAKNRNLIMSVKRPYKSFFNTVSCKSQSPENCENNSGEPKLAERVNDISKHAKRSMSNAIKTNIRKTKHNHRDAQIDGRNDGGEQGLVTREDIQNKKRRNKDRYESAVKEDVPSVVPKVDKVESKNPQFEISRKHETRVENKSNERTGKKHNAGVSGAMKSSQGDPSKRNLKASARTDGSLKIRDASDVCIAPKQVDTQRDLIAKRKQQREAVDAIMASAFIPSKRSETSAKSLPAKRPPSSATNGDSQTKPPKLGKVLPASSRSAMQDQSHPHRKRGKHL